MLTGRGSLPASSLEAQGAWQSPRSLNQVPGSLLMETSRHKPWPIRDLDHPPLYSVSKIAAPAVRLESDSTPWAWQEDAGWIEAKLDLNDTGGTLGHPWFHSLSFPLKKISELK